MYVFEGRMVASIMSYLSNKVLYRSEKRFVPSCAKLCLVCIAVVILVCSALATNPSVPVGGGNYFPPNISASPANGQAWDVVNPSGTIIATSSNPSGWTEAWWAGNIYLTCPGGTNFGNNYEVRIAGSSSSSADVIGVHPAVTPVTPPTSEAAFFNVIGAWVPTAPTNLVASSGAQQVSLTWNPSAYATSYIIYMSTSQTGPFTPVSWGVNATNYYYTGLTVGATYYFEVAGANANGYGPPSNVAGATVLSGLAAPMNLTATAGNSEVSLSWTQVYGATNYQAYLKTGPSTYTLIATGLTTTAFLDTGLVNGTSYTFVVTATNASSTSPYSLPASATPVGSLSNAPTNLTAVGNYSGTPAIDLNWTAGYVDDSVTVYRSPPPTGTGFGILATGVEGASYIDTNVSVGTTYTYYVVGITNNISSLKSNNASATPFGMMNPINIVPNPSLGFLPVSMNLPDWMSNVEPVDNADAPDGPSGAISVNLAYGVVKFDSGPDLVIKNPYGPNITFERYYRTAMAAGNLSSGGLTPGWTHNWDYWMVPTQSGWGPIQLVYPSGASEVLTPTLVNSAPTNPCSFTGPQGCPYTVTGIPSSTVGVWNSITIQHVGHEREIFTAPSGSNVYRVQTKVFGNNSILNFNWNGSQLDGISSAPTSTGLQINLLLLSYVNTLLSTALDNISGNARQYGYSGGELASVSMIGNSSNEWTYRYATIGGASYLSYAASFDPQANDTASSIGYDATSGRATGRTDQTNNTRLTSYPQAWTGTVAIQNSENTTIDTYSTTSDSLGRIQTVTNAAGNLTRYTFGNNSIGIPSTIQPPSGNPVSIGFDSSNNANQISSPFGSGTTYGWQDGLNAPAWAPNGIVTSATEFGTGNTQAPPTQFAYYTVDATGGIQGYLQSALYPNGEKVTYTYTTLGDIATVSDATGTTTYGYSTPEVYGCPITVTDPNGFITSYQYDNQYRLTGVTDPSGAQVSQQLNNYNQPTQLSLPLGISTQYNYSFSGKPPISGGISNSAGSFTTVFANTYDSQSQLTATKDANNLSDFWNLDGESNLTSLTNADGNVMHSFVYNPTENQIQTTFGTGSNALTLTDSLNPSGSLSTESGSDGRSVTINYYSNDPNQPLSSSVSDTYTNWTSLTSFLKYDPFERISDVQSQAPDQNSVTEHFYTYDNEGNVLADETFPWIIEPGLISVALPQTTITYTYNPDGTRSQMVVPLQELAITGITIMPSSVIYNYTYDAAKRLTEITVYNSLGAELAYAIYAYDKVGRVTEVRTPQATIFYKYNALGQLIQQLNLTADNTKDAYAPGADIYTDKYGKFHSLLSCFYGTDGIDGVNGGGSSNQIGITYSLTGDRLQTCFTVFTQPLVAGEDTNSIYSTGYVNRSYDASDRLTSEEWYNSLNSITPVESLTHQYDSAGNLTKLRGSTLTVDPLSDRLTNASISNYGAITYNPSGDAIVFNNNTIKYDPLGELTTIQNSTSVTNMVYDHAGRRAAIAESVGGTKDNQWFIYDGPNLVYRQFAVQVNTLTSAQQPDFNTQDNGVLYLYGPTGLIMEFDRFTNAGTNDPGRTFLYDPEGNCVSSTSGANYTDNGLFAFAAESPVLYDGYGAPVQMGWTTGGSNPLPTVTNRTTSQPFQYKGQYGCYTDGTSGLVYCAHRFYDPNVGRWTSRDPAGLDGGVNVYAFVQGDPVIGADPDGLQSNFSDPQFWFERMFNDYFDYHGPSQDSTLRTAAVCDHTLMTMDKGIFSAALFIDAYRAARNSSSGNYVGGLIGVGSMGLDCLDLEVPDAGVAIEGVGRAVKAGARGGYLFEDLMRADKNLMKLSVKTSQGWRFVDGVSAEGVGYEFKTGTVTLNNLVRKQISKDAEMVRNGDLVSVEWIFQKGSKVSRGVIEELMKNGILCHTHL